MRVVWDGNGATVRDVHTALAAERPVAYTTIMTLMRVLEAKGYLTRRRGNDRAYVYVPTHKRQQVLLAMVRDFVDRVFDGATRVAAPAPRAAGDPRRARARRAQARDRRARGERAMTDVTGRDCCLEHPGGRARHRDDDGARVRACARPCGAPPGLAGDRARGLRISAPGPRSSRPSARRRGAHDSTSSPDPRTRPRRSGPAPPGSCSRCWGSWRPCGC